ncbi:hypothetical protein [Lentibacillus jeotgali]|nr:hypothetical protein [Lentibacillus jeotgali]
MPKFDVNKALNKINEYTGSNNDNDEDQKWKDEVLERLARIEEKLDKK